MELLVFTHGGPSPALRGCARPELSPGEVLVRVRACALNHLDVWERRGSRARHDSDAPHLGERRRGRGRRVGRGRSPDRPAGHAAARHELRPLRGVPVGQGQRMRGGRGSRVPQSPGGYAEDATVPVQNVIPIPDAIDFVHAAAFPLTFLTAWHMLITRAQAEAGEDVLVLAAGSGVGQAAIQIAVLLGARVFATAGADEKLDRARTLAPTKVVHHHKQDVAAEILRLTQPARRRRRHRTRR